MVIIMKSFSCKQMQVFDYPGQNRVLKCVGEYTKIIICICHTACTMMSQLVP